MKLAAAHAKCGSSYRVAEHATLRVVHHCSFFVLFLPFSYHSPVTLVVAAYLLLFYTRNVHLRGWLIVFSVQSKKNR